MTSYYLDQVLKLVLNLLPIATQLIPYLLYKLLCHLSIIITSVAIIRIYVRISYIYHCRSRISLLRESIS